MNLFTARTLPWSVTVYSGRQTCNVWPPIGTCSFFSRCNVIESILNRENSPTYFIKHQCALICVDNRISRTQLGDYLFSDSKVSGTITRKTSSLPVHVQCIWFAAHLRLLINFLDSQLYGRPYQSKVVWVHDQWARNRSLWLSFSIGDWKCRLLWLRLSIAMVEIIDCWLTFSIAMVQKAIEY